MLLCGTGTYGLVADAHQHGGDPLGVLGRVLVRVQGEVVEGAAVAEEHAEQPQQLQSVGQVRLEQHVVVLEVQQQLVVRVVHVGQHERLRGETRPIELGVSHTHGFAFRLDVTLPPIYIISLPHIPYSISLL